LSVLWVATAAAAEDSWLYWMLGDASKSGYAADTDYNAVKVRGYTSDTEFDYLNLYYDSASGSFGQSISAATINEMNGIGAGLYAGLVNGTTYSSFVIELVNDSGGFVADSGRLSAASAAAYIETANSLKQPSAWAPVSYAIPEPNSAMLLLLGCAALGLRRRRQLKA